MSETSADESALAPQPAGADTDQVGIQPDAVDGVSEAAAPVVESEAGEPAAGESEAADSAAAESGVAGLQAGESEAGESETGEDAPGDVPLSGVRLLEREGDLAADYLETLLDIADLDGDLDMDIEGDRATVDIVGRGLHSLVGSSGETLDALQELTRLAVQRETGVRSRLMLDIGGFRANRRVELQQVAAAAADEVGRTGDAKPLPPMTPFERKVVHDAVAGVAGVVSESEGEGPSRFVVLRPA